MKLLSDLIKIQSLSGYESQLAQFVNTYLKLYGVEPILQGKNVLVHFDGLNLKKAIVSLIFGIVSPLFIVFAFYFPMPGISMAILIGSFLIALVGLILGILGLRAAKKSLAILGII